jgi:hypothetical protein
MYALRAPERASARGPAMTAGRSVSRERGARLSPRALLRLAPLGLALIASHACAGARAEGGDVPAREASRSAGALQPSDSPPPDAASPWLQVTAPGEGELLRSSLPLIELRGRIGRGPRGGHDVVIAIDQSQSSLLPTGLDLDGDGVIGTLKRGQRRDATRGPFVYWTTDRDDVVIHGEVLAARRLIDALDPERARVAIVSFSGNARTRGPLGTVADAHRALDALSITADYTGSNMSAALRHGARVLASGPTVAASGPTVAEDGAEAPGAGVARQRAVFLMLSDGVANAPLNERAARARARAAARALREMDIPIFAFEIKNEEDDDPGLLGELAELSDGRHVYVDDPAALRFELPERSFARVERVEIRNRTARRDARAIRVFPGGAFDAFAPLVPGENHLEIEAYLPGGTALSITRVVYFIEPRKLYPSDLERMEALRDALRRRTIATAQPRPPAPRARDQRSVEVEVEGLDEAVDAPQSWDAREWNARESLDPRESPDAGAP